LRRGPTQLRFWSKPLKAKVAEGSQERASNWLPDPNPGLPMIVRHERERPKG